MTTPVKTPLSLPARIDSILLALACFAACGQIDVRKFGRDTIADGLGYASKTFSLSLSDVLFLALALWFVVRTTQLGAWKKLWWPPLPCYALGFALLLAFVHSPSAAEHHLHTKEGRVALADIAQWIIYFGVAPWVFVNLLRDRRNVAFPNGIRRDGLVLGALVAAFGVSGIRALIQLHTSVEMAPRGLWTSPNLFAAFVAFMLPFLDEIEIKTTPRAPIASKSGKPKRQPILDTPPERFEYLPLALTLFCIGILWLCVVSPFAALAGWVGLLGSWLARPNVKRLRITRLAILLFIGLIFSFSWHLNPTLRFQRANELRLGAKEQPVKKRWIEWQVASRWNTLQEHAFATGFGPGNYQLKIGELYQYDQIPYIEKMPLDSNNLYLVQALSIGVLGLGALLWVVVHFMSLAWTAARRGSWLGAATFGSFCAWGVVNVFHAFIVRGAGLLLALFFALAVVAWENTRPKEASKEGWNAR